MPWLRSKAPNRVVTNEQIKLRYFPKFFDVGADKAIVIVLENMRAVGRGDECQDVLDVANTHFYGNGSVEGMFGRFMKVI